MTDAEIAHLEPYADAAMTRIETDAAWLRRRKSRYAAKRLLAERFAELERWRTMTLRDAYHFLLIQCLGPRPLQ